MNYQKSGMWHPHIELFCVCVCFFYYNIFFWFLASIPAHNNNGYGAMGSLCLQPLEIVYLA